MLRITERALRDWADVIGIDSIALAEHDYRITHLLGAVCSDEFLAERLLLKGGTAINKLYLGELSRLSVDLDFNQIGTKEEVLKDVVKVRRAIVDKIKDQDPSYKVRYDWRYKQTAVHAVYEGLTGPAIQPIKLEISHVERFPILDKKTKSFKLIDTGESCKVITYSLDELLSTKLRALFTRARGRDIYDIHQASKMGLKKRLVRKMLIYYLFRVGKVYNPKLDNAKLNERLVRKQYIDDVTGYVRQGVSFSLGKAAKSLLKDLQFLNKLDELDQNFLLMSRKLKGEAIPKAKMNVVGKIKHPLDYIFHGSNITEEARKVTVKELLPWKQHK
jgi:predicted nucleotidyltransferase component of viral defense system